MQQISYDEGHNVLAAIVADQPDYVYEPPKHSGDSQVRADLCVYVDEAGSPSCLIGHWLAEFGLLDELGITDRTTGTIGGVIRRLGLSDKFPTKLRVLLGEAQRVQDDRLPWALALQRAEEHAARVPEEW